MVYHWIPLDALVRRATHSLRANLLQFISLTNSISHGKMSWKSDYILKKKRTISLFSVTARKLDDRPNQFALILDYGTNSAFTFSRSSFCKSATHLINAIVKLYKGSVCGFLSNSNWSMQKCRIVIFRWEKSSSESVNDLQKLCLLPACDAHWLRTEWLSHSKKKERREPAYTHLMKNVKIFQKNSYH